jgi:hypothetical protein
LHDTDLGEASASHNVLGVLRLWTATKPGLADAGDRSPGRSLRGDGRRNVAVHLETTASTKACRRRPIPSGLGVHEGRRRVDQGIAGVASLDARAAKAIHAGAQRGQAQAIPRARPELDSAPTVPAAGDSHVRIGDEAASHHVSLPVTPIPDGTFELPYMCRSALPVGADMARRLADPATRHH